MFGLTEEESLQAKSEWLKHQRSIVEGMAKGKLPHELDSGKQAYIGVLSRLSEDGLRTFWLMQGMLGDEEPLENAVSKFPSSDRTNITNLIAASRAKATR